MHAFTFHINPFAPIAPFLYALTSEDHKVLTRQMTYDNFRYSYDSCWK